MGFPYLSSAKILFILFASLANAQKQVGDSCLKDNVEAAKCVLLENCPSAIKLLREKQGRPSHCGFEGRQPIVCCEDESSLLSERGEIATKKCLEYFRKDDKFIDDLLADPNRHGAVGGEDAPSKAFPHMIALGYDLQGNITWGCGGTLISEKFVLTAAHCIHTRIGQVKYARAGDLNLRINTDDAKPQNFEILRVFIHPEYKQPSSYNDIALIELSNDAQLNHYVQPACLQTATKINDTIWSATGWGATSFGGNQADHLQRILVREFSFADCQRAYASESKRKLSNGIDWQSQLCAGENRVDVCQGDSGGPLQVRRARNGKPGYFVIGVVAFGKACGIANTPSVYTRVSYYVNWIESIVWPEEVFALHGFA